MEFISTRGKDGPISFETALLNGLARDGGLYLPVSWPRFNLDEIRQMRDLSYSDLAGLIMSRFTDGEIDPSRNDVACSAKLCLSPIHI